MRNDPFAVMHRVAVEQDKPEEERGTYLHPDAYGRPVSEGINSAAQQALSARGELGGEDPAPNVNREERQNG